MGMTLPELVDCLRKAGPYDQPPSPTVSEEDTPPPPLVMKRPREKQLMRRGTQWQTGVILLKRKIPLRMGLRDNLWKKRT